MAVHARSHACGDLFLEHISLGDRAMTGLAVHTRFDVDLMTEEDKVGKSVDTHPVDGLTFADKLRQALYVRGILSDRHVTEHTLRCRRNTCSFLSLSLSVAIVALHFLCGVLAVTKWNRLRVHHDRQLFFSANIALLRK